MSRGLTIFVALLATLLVACGGGDGEDGAGEPPGVLADRFLRLNEPLSTVIEAREGELPADLGDVLNPGATADTPESELLSIPVHPDGLLVGSFRVSRVDGAILFFLFYDVPADDVTVEGTLRAQLDQSPWQVVGGQSSEDLSAVAFQPTISGDVEGTAVVRQLPVAADGTPRTSIMYIIEVQPSELAEEVAFELPESRPLPERFPAALVVMEGMTANEVQWASFPGGATYQLMLLTRQSPFDVAEAYRERLGEEGWELTDDQAVGFATILDFELDDPAMRLTISADAFDGDSSFTAVFVTLQVSR